LVSQFYEGLTPKDRQMVELMCNGTFKNKDPDEAMEYLDLLAENAQNWGTTGTCEAPGKTQPHTSSGGMYNLREDHDLQAKFTSLARKVEALELKKSGQLKSVQEIVCQIFETNEHSTNDCPTFPSFNHPNFSWKSGKHKLHSHHFKHIIIFKVLIGMHLLMFPLLEEILRTLYMHSLNSKRQSTLNLFKA
jgi:hypothetical protein